MKPRATVAKSAEAAASAGRVAPRWWFWIALGLVVWGLLIAARGEILRSPPYYETALGFYREAQFLAETDFDYMRLRYREVRGNDGGPYVYMTSVLPSLLAAAMRNLASREDVFLTAHLFSLAAGALLATLLAAILWRRVGPVAALLTALAVMTTPLVVVQMDIVSLDLTMAAAALGTIAAVVARRYALGAFLATVSFFMKATGLVITAAAFGYLAVRLVALLYLRRRGMSSAGGRGGRPQPHGGEADELRQSARGLAAFGLALAAQGAIHVWGGVGNRLHAIHFDESWLTHFLYLCPDLLVLAACAAAGVGLFVVAETARLRRGGPAGWLELAARSIVEEPLVWAVAAAAVLAAVAIRLYAGVFVIRYFLVLVPLFYLAAVIGLSHGVRSSRVVAGVLACAVVFNLANAYGRFLPDPPGNRRHCNTRERSLEYLADHRANIAAMKALAALAGATPVVAGYPYNCFLTVSEMGYVDRPLTVYATMPFLAPHVRTPLKMLDDRPRELIFITVDNPSHREGQIGPPPRTAGDEELYNDHLASPLVIFRRRLPTTDDPQQWTAWYIDNLWFNADLLERNPTTLTQRAQLLTAGGRPELALALLQKCAAGRPHDPQLHVLLGEQLLRLGNLPAAVAELDAARRLAAAPEHADDRVLAARLHFATGLAAFQQNQLDEAAAEFRAALAADDQLAEAQFLLGAIAARQENPTLARKLFKATLELAPGHLEALCYLGVLDQQAGDLPAAAARFEEALHRQPRYLTALVNLGAVRVAQGRPGEALSLFEQAAAADPRNLAAWSELVRLRELSRDDAGAVAALRQALVARPDWLEGQRRLAWLLATSWDAGLRTPEVAHELAQKLVAATGGRDAAALDTLAASLAALGRFEEAVAAAKQAVAALPAPAPAAWAAELAARLRLYENKRPYVTPVPARL